ncbi:hypothetical protein EV175_002509 [Coemansia sp. RSA 1933]|nr:hypothetical protein EV175_002509 [Coemansia sp. RSA 1933]
MPAVTVFEREGSATQFKWGPWVAGGQLLLWINFADFYWRYSVEKDEETGKAKPMATWKRVCLSAVAVVAGLAMGGGILHYISRCVARVQILNGKTVRLDVFRISGRGTVSKQFPLDSMYSWDTLYTGIGPSGLIKSATSQYSIRAPGEKYAYILSRTGRFRDPVALDILFFRQKKKISGFLPWLIRR